MTMYNIKSIRGAKAVIQCKTIEDAKALYELVKRHHSYNYESRIISKWEQFGSNTCYRLNEAGIHGVDWCTKQWYEDEGYEIIQFNDLKPKPHDKD